MMSQMTSSYLENPKNSTQKLLELINKFIKVAGFINNTQNQVCCYVLVMNNQKKKLNENLIYDSIKKKKT